MSLLQRERLLKFPIIPISPPLPAVQEKEVECVPGWELRLLKHVWHKSRISQRLDDIPEAWRKLGLKKKDQTKFTTEESGIVIRRYSARESKIELRLMHYASQKTTYLVIRSADLTQAQVEA